MLEAKAQEAAVAGVKADLETCEKQTDLLLDMRLNEQIGAGCKRRLKSAAGGARKVPHLPGKEDWICGFSSRC